MLGVLVKCHGLNKTTFYIHVSWLSLSDKNKLSLFEHSF